MSFYTSFFCYRSGPAPDRMTGPDLAQFLRQLAQIGACEGGIDVLHLKHGESIDRDANTTVKETSTDQSRIEIAEDIDWDVKLDFPSLHAAVDGLNRIDRPIYRALIELGG